MKICIVGLLTHLSLWQNGSAENFTTCQSKCKWIQCVFMLDKGLAFAGQMLTLFLHSVLDGFTLTYLSHIFQIHVCFLAPLEITRGHLSRIAWFYFQNVENNIWKMKWHVTKMGWVDISKPWHCFVLSFQMKADFHAFFLYCISE